jgi:hypothetical protein
VADGVDEWRVRLTQPKRLGYRPAMANSDPALIDGKRDGRPANAALPRAIRLQPEAITALSPALVARIAALTKGMEIDPDEEIDGEVDL